MKVTDSKGNKIDFELALAFMDDDIIEALHNEICPCSEQEFYDAYVKAHRKFYNEEFDI